MEYETHSRFNLPSDPDVNELILFFSELPDSTEYEWELAITDLVEHIDDCQILSRQILEQETLDNEYNIEKVRFAAFFLLCTYLRRQNQRGAVLHLLEDHLEFSGQAMYAHLRSMVTTDFEDKIRYARYAAEAANPHPGASHNLARIIIDGLDERKSIPIEDPLSVANRHLDIALNNADYPKHLATKGLLLALNGEYDRAREKIRQARDKENEDQENYVVRLSEYQEFLFRVRILEYESELQTEINNSYDRLSDSIQQMEGRARDLENYTKDIRTQTLQFIGFFATLIAVIITTAQFATQVPPITAAPLIIVMIGGLLIAIGGFNFTLPKHTETEDFDYRQIIPVGIGILILLIGLFSL